MGLLALFFLTGCEMSPTDTSEQEGRYQSDMRQYHDVAEKRKEENYDGKELQKERLSTNKMKSYTDPTTTETTQRISESLTESRNIIMAEVHETDDQIYVAVKLSGNNYGRSHQEDIIPEIEEKVREVTGTDEKQIIVWTDHIQWNEYRNEGARSPMLESINDFFGLENN